MSIVRFFILPAKVSVLPLSQARTSSYATRKELACAVIKEEWSQDNQLTEITNMKSLTKVSLIAALVALISTSAAFADNQRLENRLLRQHAKLIATEKTTVAFGGSPAKVRYELHTNGHGQTSGLYIPVD
jgi:hypothetical protein